MTSADRATCWSITQQIESTEEGNLFMEQQVPPGWRLTGQVEEAPTTGKLHLQLMLKTPQVRFSAVKSQFPKAHIEIARDRRALAKYVQKTETRVMAVEQTETPTLWQFSEMVANRVDIDELVEYLRTWRTTPEGSGVTIYWDDATGEEMLKYIDILVGRYVHEGIRGSEYMGINPMFRSAWKTYGRSLIMRKIDRMNNPGQ